jgi:hypothetical protein
MAAYTTIDDPSAYFKCQLYTGNGSANHAITFDDTDTDMQPDLVWIKNRDATDSHCLFDSARGVTKLVSPDSTDMQSTDTDTLDSFASDGFQVDADVKVNTNTEDYVAWCWNTQGGAGSSNTTGSINTTTTSVGATQGISVSTFSSTGSAATLGHGLGAVPHFFFFRHLTTTGGETARDWPVYHKNNTAAPETDYLILNSDAATADALLWNDTAPSSTLISIGDGSEINQVNGTYAVFAFTEKQGFSKFGTYEGNGNANGTFVYTGFRPAFVLMKCIDSSGTDWNIWDNRRPGYNPNYYLPPNKNLAEVTAHELDLLSNGFKARANNNDQNKAANTYIYAAFAEAPFVNSNGVPCNAR